jgi:uncharacterized protein (TIGR02217 family)
MAFWLAPRGAARTLGTVKRFDPRYWTVDFPRPMMASVVTTGPHALRVDAVFYRRSDLAGLIWESEDRFDHPLLAYETSRDFRTCRLSFRWRSEGVVPLDAVNGPTLTIEGRDSAGNARSWYVRLWNYASGTPEDAEVTLDFGALAGGWGKDDPVWAGDIDRLFVSMVAPGYDGTDAPLPAAVQGHVELSGIACDGSGSVLSIGDCIVPEHRLRIATAYDDLYHLTPARLLRNMLQLGYRGTASHYVGMSHYFRLAAGEGGLVATSAGGVLNAPCAAWHGDYARRAKALGFELIFSLSYELLDRHCPAAWKQRSSDGAPALTGWDPPSALLSPANADAMTYLQSAARAFAVVLRDAGLPVRFQIGEPWWWVRSDGQLCLHDAAATAAFSPEFIANVRGPLDAAQLATLDAAGAWLAASTAALRDAVRQEEATAEILLLLYSPGVTDGEVRRANAPVGWAWPAYDVLQIEDYEWVTSGNRGASEAGAAELRSRLGYPPGGIHYFAGFVSGPERRDDWRAIASAASGADAAERFLWALPQVLRDGFTWFDEGEKRVDAYEDVLFPVAIGREASVETAFSTAVVTTASGAEQRNSDWADARMRFDAGPGLRSEAELAELVSFFRARRGAAVAFRFRDPFDHRSSASGEPGPFDQLLGTGDGVATDFPLVKRYGSQVRRITRPAAGSVRVAVAGAERSAGWVLGEQGIVRFETAPAAGAQVHAGFVFDVPVRFAEDKIDVSRATFAAGEAPSVPLIEVREP